MALSPSHKFGQIVGNLLEQIIEPVLREFCNTRGLYLDVKGKRTGVRAGKKVTWSDKYGNDHDLDFVIEKGGSTKKMGRPVAFIEAAWRRYTKHSKNKAQEIQGAVLPIAEKYQWDRPFLGAVLAGVFTSSSLSQLSSVGFNVLYFPYESVVAAFESVGINVRFDEETPDEEFKACVTAIEMLPDSAFDELRLFLVKEKEGLFQSFLNDLAKVLDRMIDRLIIIPLFGEKHEFNSIEDGVNYINSFVESENGGVFRKYEIIVKYSNGDVVDASFQERERVLRFLEYLSG